MLIRPESNHRVECCHLAHRLYTKQPPLINTHNLYQGIGRGNNDLNRATPELHSQSRRISNARPKDVDHADGPDAVDVRIEL